MTAPQPVRLASVRHGFQRKRAGGRWNVWAPFAEQVELALVRGTGREYLPMQAEEFGWFSHEQSQVEEGQRYLFRLNGRNERPDPASQHQPDGVHQASAVFSPDRFHWTDHGWRWMRRKPTSSPMARAGISRGPAPPACSARRISSPSSARRSSIS